MNIEKVKNLNLGRYGIRGSQFNEIYLAARQFIADAGWDGEYNMAFMTGLYAYNYGFMRGKAAAQSERKKRGAGAA